MPSPDLHAEFETIREELICREFYGRMIQRLEGKMDLVARYLDHPWGTVEIDPSLIAIEAILIRVIEQADRGTDAMDHLHAEVGRLKREVVLLTRTVHYHAPEHAGPWSDCPSERCVRARAYRATLTDAGF